MLTAREEQFCQAYATTRNFAKSYTAAYAHNDDWDYKKRDYQGRLIWKRQDVRERVKEIVDEAAAPVIFTVETAIRMLVSMAMVDVNEIIANRVGACRRCHGQAHEFHWRAAEYLDAVTAATAAGQNLPPCSGGLDYDATRPPHPDCPQCHGEGISRVVLKDTTELPADASFAYGGVKQTRNGIEVVLPDRVKCIELACKLAGHLTDRVNVSGVMGSLTTAIDPEATAEEASRAYQQMIGALSTR